MPFAAAGPTITDSAQINTGVVNSGDIANGAIVNDDINAAAGIALSKITGAAASGANSDITSLTGLTTALSVAQGGSGATTLDDHFVLVGSGAGAITPITPDQAGYVLMSNGVASDPTFQANPLEWEEVGRTRNAGAQTGLSVGSLPDRDHYLCRVLLPGSCTADTKLTLNADSGNNYCNSYSNDRAAKANVTSTSGIYVTKDSASNSTGFIHISAIAGAYKTVISHFCDATAANANPHIFESWGCWANNANAITTITLTGSANLPAGSTMTVYASYD